MKLSMKKIKIASILLFAGVSILGFTLSNNFVTTTKATISGPPAARTGAPGESNCTACHTLVANTGTFTITPPANYTPGQTYQIVVRHTTADTTRRRWGFELTALSPSNTMAGTLAVTSTNTKIISNATKSYVEHTSTGSYGGQTGGAVWTFNWTAPTANVGNVTFYAAGIQGDNNGNEDSDQMYLTNAVSQPAVVVVPQHHVVSDFDGDGKSDTAIFRPSSGIWWINKSSGGNAGSQWGVASDVLAPADYDGDDKADIAVWRSAGPQQSTFYVLQSSTNTMRADQFGEANDVPVSKDYDGDGKADIAVYRSGANTTASDPCGPSQSVWYYHPSATPATFYSYGCFGVAGDKPVLGDFDGDAKADFAVFRSSNSMWYINQSSNNTVRFQTFGLSTDKLVPNDYDGDGKTDVAVFRASNSTWYLLNSATSTVQILNWGLSSDALVPADYDGDGKTDIAVYRGGAWYIRATASGTVTIQNYGSATDTPLPAGNLQ
jgi:FG-GAP-like repeat/Reeler domain